MAISRRQFLSDAVVAAPVGAFLVFKGNDGLVQFAADKPVPGPGIPRVPFPESGIRVFFPRLPPCGP